MRLTLTSTQNKQKIRNAHKEKKTSFSNESVENADFYKLVLIKIMTTRE